MINDRPVVGGNNSSEIRVHLGGRIEEGTYKELGGLQKEFGPEKGGNAQPAEYYEDQKKMDWLAGEKNVSLFLNFRAIGVTKEGDKITSVIVKHIESGKELKFEAPLFSDWYGRRDDRITWRGPTTVWGVKVVTSMVRASLRRKQTS